MLRTIHFLAACLCLALAACGDPPPIETTTVTPTPTPAAEIFPLRIAANRRYLETRSGTPFLIHGDTAWSILLQLPREDVLVYLEDRRARGFNTILIKLIEHKFGDAAPANWYGDAPFLDPGDFSKPNDAYFTHADWVLDQARQMGFSVLLIPAYLGYRGGDEGWYQELKASKVSVLRQYGRFLGERYRHMDNIIWMHGGDFNPPHERTVTLIAEALHEVIPDRLATAHCARETGAAEFWGNEPWLNLNNAYTGGPVFEASLRQYFRPGPVPYFFLEGIYENERDAATILMRIQAYHALLSGAAGQVFGNNPIWRFDGPGLFPAPGTWKEALDGPGSRGMAVLWTIFSRLAWWQLVPDIHRELLVDGLLDGHERAVAAVAADGTFALAYLPSRREVTFDFSRLSGRNVTAEWIDPTDGNRIEAAETPLDTHSIQRLAPPAANAAGDHDWVLLVEVVDAPRL